VFLNLSVRVYGILFRAFGIQEEYGWRAANINDKDLIDAHHSQIARPRLR